MKGRQCRGGREVQSQEGLGEVGDEDRGGNLLFWLLHDVN